MSQPCWQCRLDVEVSHSAASSSSSSSLSSSCASQLTGNDIKRNLGALSGATNQLDGDGAGGVLGGSLPLDGERSTGVDDLVGAGDSDGVKVGSLGKGRGDQSQESGNRQSESHLDG